MARKWTNLNLPRARCHVLGVNEWWQRLFSTLRFASLFGK